LEILVAYVSERSETFERAWGRFREAFDREDDERTLVALREWIVAWDECVLASETEIFRVAYHGDVEAVNHLPLPGMSDVHGLDDLREQLDGLLDVTGRFRFDVTGFERHGNRFLGRGIFRARGRYSGLIFRFPLAVLWTYEAGKISRIETFASRRRAGVELRKAEPVG
jgi:hypothetical protein